MNECESNSNPEFVEFPTEFVVESFDSAAAMFPQPRAVDVRRALIVCSTHTMSHSVHSPRSQVPPAPR